MAISRVARNKGLRWISGAAAVALAGAATFVPAYQAGKKAEPQDKEAGARGIRSVHHIE